MSVTEACVNAADVTAPEHDRCVGATYTSWIDQGTPCGCPCHTLPRCFSVYTGQGSTAYFCDLHLGHGGNFHRDRFVLWSRGHHRSEGRES